MAEHFGKQLRRKLEELEGELVDRLRGRRTSWYREEYLREFGYFEGCTEDEIENLKRVQRVNYIPKIYYEFLEVMGRKCGNVLFRGGDFDYMFQMQGIKVFTEEIVASTNETLRLPSDAYVFLMYHVVEFWFFPLLTEMMIHQSTSSTKVTRLSPSPPNIYPSGLETN